ncbi:SMI1/KNR4 family protein [Pseudogracilibacillus auburnensis]|nr:SMI1/KNR4 family protein [Pseudogracilibacillus auburnensis]
MNEEKLEFLNKYTLDKNIQIELVELENINEIFIPDYWIKLFSENSNEERIQMIINHWEEILGFEMRNTISYFKEYLIDVELMKIANKHFILYSLQSSSTDTVLFYCGGNPLEKNFDEQTELKKDWKKIPKKLRQFYEEIHDGFYYFPSRSMGLDAIENITYLDEFEWSVIEDLDKEIMINIETSYGFFSNGVGKFVVIDVDNSRDDQAVLWSNGSLPRYNLNFWDIVDEWTVIGFN